jgi:hypothetical protein
MEAEPLDGEVTPHCKFGCNRILTSAKASTSKYREAQVPEFSEATVEETEADPTHTRKPM